MHNLSRQLFSWRKALLRLIALVIFIPGLLLSYGILTTGTAAQARTVTSHISPPGHVTVSSAVKHDVSPPLRSIKPVHSKSPRQHPLLHLPPLRQGVPNGLHDHVQNSPVPVTIPAPTYNFGGVGNGFTGPQGTFNVNAAPPDTNGAVGPQDYVQTVNTDFAVFNRTPTVVRSVQCATAPSRSTRSGAVLAVIARLITMAMSSSCMTALPIVGSLASSRLPIPTPTFTSV